MIPKQLTAASDCCTTCQKTIYASCYAKHTSVSSSQYYIVNVHPAEEASEKGPPASSSAAMPHSASAATAPLPILSSFAIPPQTLYTQMHMTASASARGASPHAQPAVSPACREASGTIETSEAAAAASAAAAALEAEATYSPARGTSADSLAEAEAEAAAMPTAEAAIASSQAAATMAAAEQLQTGVSHQNLTTGTPAAVSASTCISTPAATGDYGQDIAQQCLVSDHQAVSSAEGMQDNDSAGNQARCKGQTAVATAVGHSYGTSPFSQACLADSALQRLGRDASIAQVLASLNQLPTSSNQRGLVSHGDLPQQTNSAQHRFKSVQLQAPPQQAGKAQLNCSNLTQLPQIVCVTQPLSPLSVRHVTQQLSPVHLDLPQKVHVHAAQSSELQGDTQTISPTQLRAATEGIRPSASESELFGANGIGVSLPNMEMTRPVPNTGLVQSINGKASFLGYPSYTVHPLC